MNWLQEKPSENRGKFVSDPFKYVQCVLKK